ncbi:Thermostable beta-glucosidase B [Diplonema papillatum]|nr:Thermostable beta-glucosidase B [Diplonema papillatum]
MFDVGDVLKDLTRQEKVRLLCGKDEWQTHEVERLGIPSMRMTDGAHGVRLAKDGTPGASVEATAFPVEATMASTWNPKLVQAAAQAIGDECRSLRVHLLLGPGVNGKRSPLAGRNFEYFSEDPFLASEMAVAFVKGLQSRGVGACLKHYVGNEQETRRLVVNSVISERPLHEIYLFPFARVIKKAKPWAVMAAYNSVNGTTCTNHTFLLTSILRERLGFKGLVLSDWGAVKHKVAAHREGLDLEMPGPGRRDAELLKGLESGAIQEKTIDERVSRVLEAVNAANTVKESWEQSSAEAIDSKARHDLAVAVAQEGLVLLKNSKRALPLDKQKTTALIGQFAGSPRYQGTGSSRVAAKNLTNAYDSCRARQKNILWAAGYAMSGKSTDSFVEEAVQAAAKADQVVFFTGTTEDAEGEGVDRASLLLPPTHSKLIEALYRANQKLVVVLYSGSALETRAIDPHAPAILYAGLPGEGGGEAVARVLYGEVNPSGKLSETFPERLEHNPTYETFPGGRSDTKYTEGIFVGYRYYDTKKLPVQYPFGFGLSYTSFKFSSSDYESTTRVVTVTVTNTGAVAGAEVVQVYIHDEKSTYRRPEQELKGFAKVFLGPGEKKKVSIQLDETAFSYFVTHLGRFAEESGRFEIRIGSSSREIHEILCICHESDTECRVLPTVDDTVHDWSGDERTAGVVEELFDELELGKGHPMWGIVQGLPVKSLPAFLPSLGFDDVVVEEVKSRLNIP